MLPAPSDLLPDTEKWRVVHGRVAIDRRPGLSGNVGSPLQRSSHSRRPLRIVPRRPEVAQAICLGSHPRVLFMPVRKEGDLRVQEIRVGAKKRPLFILDGVMDPKAARIVYEFFRRQDFRFSDSDRPDTRHVKHLVHFFEPEEWTSNPILARMIELTADFLTPRTRRIPRVTRAYANFNLFGDFQFAHDDGCPWTSLIFVNDRWEQDWGGELLVYSEDPLSPALAIRPEPGRAVIFDGCLTHRGGVPSKHCLEPRITLALKLNERS